MDSRFRRIFFVLILSPLLANNVQGGVGKRAAILSPHHPSFYSPESGNDIPNGGSIFVTKKVDYPGNRSPRNLFNETSGTSTTVADTTSADDADTGRKASPDVQDIIDGIVKLLGGKVHPSTPASTQLTPPQQPQPSQPSHPHPRPNYPLQQQQPSNRAPVTTHLPPSTYNLFQPQTPIGKPSRINNRGPPVIDPRPLNERISTSHQQSGQPHQHQHHHNYDHHNRPHVFKNPARNDYPPHQQHNQQRPGTVHFPSEPYSSSEARPGQQPIFEAIPLEALSGGHGHPPQKIGPPFPLPTVGYRPSLTTLQPPYRQGIPLPQQLVPTKFGITSPGQNEWPKVPSPPTIPPIVAEEQGQKTSQKPPGTLLVPAPTTLPPPAYTEDDEEEDGQNYPSGVAPSGQEPTQYEQENNNEPQYPQQGEEEAAVVEPSSVEADFGLSTPSIVSSLPQAATFQLESSYSSSSLSSPIQPSRTIPSDLSTAFHTSALSPSTYPSAPLTSPTPPYQWSSSSSSSSSSSTLSTAPTPPLRPGIVINDKAHPLTPASNSQGYGSVEVVTAEAHGPGEVFDVTVTAKQNYGQVTGQPFVIPVDLKEDLITAPKGDQQYVSIDGKRQYFNLHPNNGAVVGSVTQTQLKIQPNSQPVPSASGSVNPVPLPQMPLRPISTSLTIQPRPSDSNNKTDKPAIVNKAPPNIIRRPITRKPAIPPVRIDTCIVGDDSTCNSDSHEVCRTESGVSSCMCRAGYARRRHREPCKAIVSMVLSIKLDKLGDKKLNYNPDYFNPNTETYQTIEWETIHGLDAAMSDTTLQAQYVGSKLDAIGFDGRHAVVNTTVLLQENPKVNNNQVKRELQRQLIQSLTRSRNNFGKSQLWVEGPISAVSAIEDVNECENPELNDCDIKAKCVNTFGSFECKCDAGYGDPHQKDKRLSGRKCESCSGKNYCNNRGECLIENGHRTCKCSGNYYGSACDIDGEVLAVAIGASISAIVIIGLTLACLCMWSRRWKKEEQKAALMSRTLFGGMASQALSYLSKNTISGNNPYQPHVTLDDRLRWAQANDPNLNSNIYVQNEPMSMCAPPTLMDTRRSAETLDTTVDDIFDDRHPTKRPRSRSSQMQPGGIYYDLEPQSEMYGSSPMVQFPAQFCVPMSPYARNFYN